jgi:hypothetical protein
MGASMIHRIVLAAAIILVLALAETTDDVKLGLGNISKAGHPRTASLSMHVDGNRPSSLFSVPQSANSWDFHGNFSDSYSPFSCLQMQAIDEIELLNEVADCD